MSGGMESPWSWADAATPGDAAWLLMRAGGAPGEPRTKGGTAVAEAPTLACALGNRHLLLVHRLPEGDDPRVPGDVEVRAPGAPRWEVFETGDGRPPLLLALVEARSAGRAAGTVSLARTAGEGPDVVSELAFALADPWDVARAELAGLAPETREAIVAFLADCSGAGEDEVGGMSLSRGLKRMRDALREVRPVRVRSPRDLQALNVEFLHALDGRSFWIRGWLVERDAPPARLTAVSPEGHRAELLDALHRHVREDVEKVFGSGRGGGGQWGFVGQFRLPTASRLPEGWVLELENELGTSIEVEMPAAQQDPAAARERVLHDLALDRSWSWGLAERHGRPALARLQERLAASVSVRDLVQYGAAPARPRVTVVVPLYRRLDFLEHQMAQWVHDPTMGRQDLLYVLDSPEQADELEALARSVYGLYRVPFRTAVLSANLGFSGANNVGAELGRGEKLLLLNSDVLPAGPGWLDALVAAHDELPDAGAVGPKLLYEDDSLQHAGLFFHREPGGALWENAHYFKGLHRGLPAANVPRDVPAVTGACLLIDRSLYRSMGGLGGTYVQGDYEDSDLCLRLLEAGRRNRYVPGVELYHLEGQSYPGHLRRLTRRFNTWLQTHLWGASIEALMADEDRWTAPLREARG